MPLETPCLPPCLQEKGPYHHDIEIAEGVYTNPATYRIRNFRNLIFPHLVDGSRLLQGKSVLDLGCNCGGVALTAWKLGAERVTGIDCRPEHIEQANAIRDYLKADKVNFICADVAKITELNVSPFDIVIAAGILYHLSDPINTFRRIASLCRETFVIESHVHYSSDTRLEDIPSWWMLSDTDTGDLDGLYDHHPLLSADNYAKFEHEVPVNYNSLPNQFEPSPQGNRELRFAAQNNPLSLDGPTQATIASKDVGELVLVPNKKALTRLLRYNGFIDVVDVVPHRFSEVRWLKKYRVALIGKNRARLPADFDQPVLPLDHKP